MLDFGEITMRVKGNVVPPQEGCGDAWGCAVSIETNTAHTAASARSWEGKAL